MSDKEKQSDGNGGMFDFLWDTDTEIGAEAAEEMETLHIEDVDDCARQQVRDRLAACLDDAPHIEDATVVDVYVYGSFADGTALARISDLDIRVVVDCEDMYMSEKAEAEDYIIHEMSPHLTEGTPFGFVDARLVRAGSDAADGEVVL